MIRLQEKDDNIDSVDELGASAEGESIAPDAPDLSEDNDACDLDIDSTPEAPPSTQITIETFSTEVFKTLLNKNVPPLPLNYQTYFEALLNTKGIDFQKKIHDIMESDNQGNDERNITFEKNIHAAFANTRDIMKCTSSIYKNLVIMNDIDKRWSADLERNIANSANYKLESQNIQRQVDSQINQLKILYQKCNKILENINTNTMYDSKFNTYNKRYFIYLVQNEQKMIEKFAHTSTIIMMSLPLSVTRYLQNDQTTALIVMKTVAKLLLKTSRRSDIIGYVGNGIFGMLLKHSDLFSTQKASERVIDLMKNTNVFLDKREIHLDLNIGISKLCQERGAEDSLNCAINALRNAQKSNVEYMIYKDDKE